MGALTRFASQTHCETTLRRSVLRAVVIIDLAPSDSGWMELVKDLTNAGINVLVTVREEDFHRAGMASRDVPLGEVALDSVTRQEAKDILRLAGAPRRCHTTPRFR